MTTAEYYRQRELSPLVQTARYIFNISLCNVDKVLLSELLEEIKTGKTPSKTEKRFYENEFIDWFKPNEIGNKKYLSSANEKLSKYAYENGQTSIYKPNTILINAIGDIGRITILKHEASSNQQITGIKTNENRLLTEFCYYYLLANRECFLKDLSQTTLPIVNQKKIGLIPIILPSIAIQQRIVNFLCDLESVSTIDELNEIENYNGYIEIAKRFYIYNDTKSEISSELTHQLNLIKNLRQQILQDAVQGKLVQQDPKDEPASKLLERIKTEKEQLIKEGKIKKEKNLPPIKLEEMPFEIPKNWVWCRIGNASIKIGSGSTPKGSNYSNSGIPFFRSQNIHDCGLIYNDIKYISNEVHKNMNGTVVLPSDLLLNITGGSLGRCAIVPENFTEGNVSQHVCIIRPFLLDNSFVHYIILSPFFQKLIFGSTTGAGREGLPKYNLEQFLIPIPSLNEQYRIVVKIEQLMKLCDELEQNVQQNQKYTQELLQVALKEALETGK